MNQNNRSMDETLKHSYMLIQSNIEQLEAIQDWEAIELATAHLAKIERALREQAFSS
ncbi:hypothetical protein GOP80_01980 [Planococcaceae bacterium Storch 2/2-2]|nr:hypothetical protein [Planococcaceae bacterium Storch 2/2-2]